MTKFRNIAALLCTGLFTVVLMGCNSLPSIPSFEDNETAEMVSSWVEDLVADLGFGSMVSSRIGDARPIVPWLEGFANTMSPVQGKSFDMKPGYYRFRVESFCLDPGAYGPAASEGQLMAPLSGQRARLVKSILGRASEHPEIPQRDIQRFLWGIDAGMTLPEFPENVRNRIQPLLTPQEALQLSIDGGEIASFIANQFLPAEAQEMVARFQQIRGLLMDAQATFQALEQVAVQLGVAPHGPGSQQLKPGYWSYAGDGFYARTIPESYKVSRLEVLRPAPYRIERDDLGRVVQFESGDYRIEASYDGRPGQNVVRGPNGQEGHIWHFKRLKFSGPRRGKTVWCNKWNVYYQAASR